MKRNFFRSGVFLLVAATLAYVAVIAYLGTFSRYMSDDYCEAVSTKSSSPLTAVITRYEAGDCRAGDVVAAIAAGVLSGSSDELAFFVGDDLCESHRLVQRPSSCITALDVESDRGYLVAQGVDQGGDGSSRQAFSPGAGVGGHIADRGGTCVGGDDVRSRARHDPAIASHTEVDAVVE